MTAIRKYDPMSSRVAMLADRLNRAADRALPVLKAIEADTSVAPETRRARVERVFRDLRKSSEALAAAQWAEPIEIEDGDSNVVHMPAYQTLLAKAREYRKTAEGIKLTEAQAFSKIYTDPANRELVSIHKSEAAPWTEGIPDASETPVDGTKTSDPPDQPRQDRSPLKVSVSLQSLYALRDELMAMTPNLSAGAALEKVIGTPAGGKLYRRYRSEILTGAH